ncbi:MAG TPA: 7TM diverse intracellular signaling domain-containing protein [bacterium]
MKTHYSVQGLRRFRMLVVATVIVGALSGCARNEGRPEPRAVAGVLDLRDWDFAAQGPVRLNGAWEMHWQRLPEDLSRAAASGPEQKPVYFDVPASWTGQTWNGAELPAHGYATYRLRVLTRPSQPLPGADPLAVRTDSMGTAFELRVDGKRIAGNGQVGATTETSRPEFRNLVKALPPLAAESEWVLAISNFDYHKGGPWNPVELGPVSELNQTEIRRGELDLFLIGSLTIMGLYHLGLFALRRQDRSALYFGVLCFVITFRQASTSTRFLLDVVDAFPWPLLMRVQFITFFLAVVFGALCTRALFPQEVPRRVAGWAVALGVAATAFTVMTPPHWFSYVINPYLAWTLAICIYLLWCTVAAVRHRRDGALTFLLGATVLVAATANDFLHYLEVFRYRYLVPFGFVAFIFAQAFVFSRRSVQAIATVEALSASLELKVKARTQELAEKNAELVTTVEDLQATRKQLQQVGISVRSGTDYVVLPYNEVLFLTVQDGKTVIRTMTREHELTRPMKDVEEMLSEDVFQRIHRQYIVNVAHVDHVSHVGSGNYIAVLRGREAEPLPVSRVYAPQLKRRLGIPE